MTFRVCFTFGLLTVIYNWCARAPGTRHAPWGLNGPILRRKASGAHEIFQRMATYAKYTVAMTSRICFTFNLLTVIYNWRAHPPSRLACSHGIDTLGRRRETWT